MTVPALEDASWWNHLLQANLVKVVKILEERRNPHVCVVKHDNHRVRTSVQPDLLRKNYVIVELCQKFQYDINTVTLDTQTLFKVVKIFEGGRNAYLCVVRHKQKSCQGWIRTW